MLIEVNHLTKYYGKEEIFRNISFRVDRPKIIGLVGPNGVGKTTLLDILTNLIPYQQGEIKILNRNHRDKELFKEMGYMQDHVVLYDYLTGYDHLQFLGQIHKLPHQKLLDTAELIGTSTYLNKKVKHYSLGMKRKLLLTMSLLHDPKLLLLDEPLNGLDPTSTIQLRNTLKSVFEQGTTILLSSHQLFEIDQLTKDIFFLKDGQLIEKDLTDYLHHQYVLTFEKTEPLIEILKEQKLTFRLNQRDLVCEIQDKQTLQKTLRLLDERQIYFKSLDQQHSGSQSLYQNLYLGEKV
ncbi:ABC transporter ATP-binding protein [Amphibacillus sp. Q70]|uniref:ABC transporter ATP-binding protein n=1 Tax=Amphibacillus sp. Q70 TaxID=3453416 RepID=UPI003F8682D6